MITLRRLQWDNCFSYGQDNDLILNDTAVTQIIGTNGMGKSSIPLIIEEALYNKNSKGIKKADIPNRYINDGYKIVLTFSKDEDIYSVNINRKTNIKVKLEKNGEDYKKVTYKDLDKSSSRFANALLNLGIEKKDKVLVILPRVPEWYSVLFGCAKMGAVAMPGTTLLTAKDIEYRVVTSKAKVIVVSKLHSDAVEQIKSNCPTLQHIILVRGERNGF